MIKPQNISIKNRDMESLLFVTFDVYSMSKSCSLGKWMQICIPLASSDALPDWDALYNASAYADDDYDDFTMVIPPYSKYRGSWSVASFTDKEWGKCIVRAAPEPVKQFEVIVKKGDVDIYGPEMVMMRASQSTKPMYGEALDIFKPLAKKLGFEDYPVVYWSLDVQQKDGWRPFSIELEPYADSPMLDVYFHMCADWDGGGSRAAVGWGRK